MWRKLWKWIMKLSGWSIQGNLPTDLNKYVIAVAPHTSNWDFLVGVMVRESLGFKGRFLGKDSLFKSPFGFFFKAIGGIPVDRSTSRNMVSKVADIITESDEFILAIAPEGTRKEVKKWKTGFYYIAVEAGIPIVMAAMDYEERKVLFSKPFFTTGDVESDLQYIKSFFQKAKGFNEVN